MGSEDYRLPRLLTLGHDIPEFASGYRVHSGRWLVQEHYRRLSDERHRCAQLPLIAAAVRSTRAISILLQTLCHNITDLKII